MYKKVDEFLLIFKNPPLIQFLHGLPFREVSPLKGGI